MNRTTAIAIASLSLAGLASAGDQIGWTAELETRFHGVRGTATIVDASTIRIDDFHFDGAGIDVYFYLGVDTSSFGSGVQLGSQLVGTSFTGVTIELDVPAEVDVSAYSAISVWCTLAAVSFGDGLFAPPCEADLVPPSSLDFFDILEFLSLFDAADARADLASPFGTHDLFDLLEYLARFDAGCPTRP